MVEPNKSRAQHTNVFSNTIRLHSSSYFRSTHHTSSNGICLIPALPQVLAPHSHLLDWPRFTSSFSLPFHPRSGVPLVSFERPASVMLSFNLPASGSAFHQGRVNGLQHDFPCEMTSSRAIRDCKSAVKLGLATQYISRARDLGGLGCVKWNPSHAYWYNFQWLKDEQRQSADVHASPDAFLSQTSNGGSGLSCFALLVSAPPSSPRAEEYDDSLR